MLINLTGLQNLTSGRKTEHKARSVILISLSIFLTARVFPVEFARNLDYKRKAEERSNNHVFLFQKKQNRKASAQATLSFQRVSLVLCVMCMNVSVVLTAVSPLTRMQGIWFWSLQSSRFWTAEQILLLVLSTALGEYSSYWGLGSQEIGNLGVNFDSATSEVAQNHTLNKYGYNFFFETDCPWIHRNQPASACASQMLRLKTPCLKDRTFLKGCLFACLGIFI